MPDRPQTIPRFAMLVIGDEARALRLEDVDRHGHITAEADQWMRVSDVLPVLAASGSTVRALREVLKSVEFRGHGGRRCPSCAGWMASPHGETDLKHSKQCILAAALLLASPQSQEGKR